MGHAEQVSDHHLIDEEPIVPKLTLIKGGVDAQRERYIQGRQAVLDQLAFKLEEGWKLFFDSNKAGAMEIRDDDGHTLPYLFNRQTAEAIDQAMWTAGELSVDDIARHTIDLMEQQRFDFTEPEHISISLHGW